MRRNKTKILSILLIVAIGITGIIGFYIYFDISKKPSARKGGGGGDGDSVVIYYDDFEPLLTKYRILTGDYDTVFDSYEELEEAYNITVTIIRSQIFPIQYSIFAEAVRRYYMPLYLTGTTEKEVCMNVTMFWRDIILHDSNQYNSFGDVSDAFSDVFETTDTMFIANFIMYYMFYGFEGMHWLPNWGGKGLLGNDNLTDIDTIVQWCIDEIGYEYDSDIIIGQENPTWDYNKFPVETAFRSRGDCEDQAILTTAYLESCGFETIIVYNHDPDHPLFNENGGFYHGSCMVQIINTIDYISQYGSDNLWTIDGGITAWTFIDTTWDIPFGSIPGWLDYYIDNPAEFNSDVMSYAFCDIDGEIGSLPTGNIGMTCVVPT